MGAALTVTQSTADTTMAPCPGSHEQGFEARAVGPRSPGFKVSLGEDGMPQCGNVSPGAWHTPQPSRLAAGFVFDSGWGAF